MNRLALPLLLVATSALASPRYALIVGSNQGAPRRPTLWYAERDATRVAHALTELGDFSPANVVVLRGPTPDEVRRTLQLLESRATAQKALLFFYFSGHANATGLELGTQQLDFTELRRAIGNSRADVKVAIVDSCDSGALTQVKGGKPVASLNFPLPGDDNVQGTAFVASTSLGELAQESAALEGSFFTHYLEVGMRGAADADGDGRVTLNEAFRYTSTRTVSGTLQTEAGPQHPTYEMKMSGRGDVVLTDTRRAEAHLQLPPAPGALFVLRGPRGLTAEVVGAPTPLVLALPVGGYRIERRTSGSRQVAELQLSAGELQSLPESISTPYERGRTKGGATEQLELYVGGVVADSILPGFGPAFGARLAVQHPFGALVLRISADFGRQAVSDANLRYDVDRLGGMLSVRWRAREEWPRIELGPEAGGAWMHQTLFETSYDAAEGSAGAGGHLSIPIGPLRLAVEASGGGRVFQRNSALTVKPTAGAALLIGAQL
ncbi:MAG: caspase family protein [Myxococcaceae bacterium]